MHERFFTLVRTRGDPDGPPRKMGLPKSATVTVDRRRQLDIELDVTGHLRALGRRAQRQKAVRIGPRLRGDDDAV